jgi:hypothetical protein
MRLSSQIGIGLVCIGVHLSPLHAQTNQVERLQLRKVLQEASTDYQKAGKDSLNAAAARFRAVREQGPEGEYDPDALRLAEGMSLLQAGDPQQALGVLEEVEGFEEPEDRARLRRLKGVARMQSAEAAVAAEQWDEAEQGMQEAITSFTNALKAQPDSADNRLNLELSRQRLHEIQQARPTPTPTPPPQPTPTPDPQSTPTPEPEDSPDQQESSGQQDNTQEQPQATPTPDPESQSEPEESASEESDPEENQESEGSEQEAEPQSGQQAELSEEEVDAQEAERILEAYLEQEKRQRRQILEQQQRSQNRPVEKDW